MRRALAPNEITSRLLATFTLKYREAVTAGSLLASYCRCDVNPANCVVHALARSADEVVRQLDVEVSEADRLERLARENRLAEFYDALALTLAVRADAGNGDEIDTVAKTAARRAAETAVNDIAREINVAELVASASSAKADAMIAGAAWLVAGASVEESDRHFELFLNGADGAFDAHIASRAVAVARQIEESASGVAAKTAFSIAAVCWTYGAEIVGQIAGAVDGRGDYGGGPAELAHRHWVLAALLASRIAGGLVLRSRGESIGAALAVRSAELSDEIAADAVRHSVEWIESDLHHLLFNGIRNDIDDDFADIVSSARELTGRNAESRLRRLTVEARERADGLMKAADYVDYASMAEKLGLEAGEIHIDDEQMFDQMLPAIEPGLMQAAGRASQAALSAYISARTEHRRTKLAPAYATLASAVRAQESRMSELTAVANRDVTLTRRRASFAEIATLLEGISHRHERVGIVPPDAVVLALSSRSRDELRTRLADLQVTPLLHDDEIAALRSMAG